MKKINCILLIDDNAADNEYHKIIITEADVCSQIQIVTDGQKALDYIIKAEETHSVDFPKPDLIYLDINMPGMNGFEFLEKYHKLEEKLKSKVTVVMLTTSLNPDDQKRALENKEIIQFQNKPLTVEMVRETVGKYF